MYNIYNKTRNCEVITVLLSKYDNGNCDKLLIVTVSAYNNDVKIISTPVQSSDIVTIW